MKDHKTKGIYQDHKADTTKPQGEISGEKLSKFSEMIHTIKETLEESDGDLNIQNVQKKGEKGLVTKKEITSENNREDNKSETAEKTKGFLIDSDLKEKIDESVRKETENVFKEEENDLSIDKNNQDASELELSLTSIDQKENQLETDLKQKRRRSFENKGFEELTSENNIKDNRSERSGKTNEFSKEKDMTTEEETRDELTSEESIEDNKSGNDVKANNDFINGTLKNNIFKKDSNEKEDKETRIEIPENFFYKENNCYYCNDINLLKKIYETQKSFSKTELYLKTQACKYTPSLTTIQKLVRKSFESESEYKTWRSNIFLKEFQEIARERGGICLSTEYDNSYTKLEFLCARGHRFEAKPVNVKNNDSWCPTCSEGTSERVCGGLAEAIFKRKFQSHVRFNWLRSEKNHLMHLDRYNDELKLAFEIQGIQHYMFPNRFHKTEEEFSRQLFLDQRKRELVEHHGITLIEVPFTIKYDKMQEYIIEQCRANGLKVQEPKSKIDWRKFRWYINDDDMSLNDWL